MDSFLLKEFELILQQDINVWLLLWNYWGNMQAWEAWD